MKCSRCRSDGSCHDTDWPPHASSVERARQDEGRAGDPQQWWRGQLSSTTRVPSGHQVERLRPPATTLHRSSTTVQLRCAGSGWRDVPVAPHVAAMGQFRWIVPIQTRAAAATPMGGIRSCLDSHEPAGSWPTVPRFRRSRARSWPPAGSRCVTSPQPRIYCRFVLRNWSTTGQDSCAAFRFAPPAPPCANMNPCPAPS